ncbi:MAG TPA: protein translocase subunit SecD [Anaerolineae bacterium]
MRNRDQVLLIFIILLTLLAVWIALPIQHPVAVTQFLGRDLQLKEGLDLQGGTQVLLQAVTTGDQKVSADDMNAVKGVVARRVNGLGVNEPNIQLQGNNRIIVELPGINDPDAAVQTLKSTGQLEFVEFGPVSATGAPTDYPNIGQGVYVRTTTSDRAPGAAISNTVKFPYPNQTFKTIMTGRELQNVTVQLAGTTGSPTIAFQLTDAGSKTFGDYTSAHVNDVLGIVLDNIVLSAPKINSAITGGSGVIEGRFTLEEANNLMVQMKYGSLPVPLEVVDRRTIGATLGGDSVRRSIVAGLVGLIVVILFMIAQYRLPGVLAAVALVIYAALNLMIYKLVPVTLTLPGIAGFLLSTGMAVDANVLIFERMKEELRWGKSLEYAVDTAFHRAWPSIRDSNLSTIISCIVLVMFGRTFGAQTVMGFALNLGIGVLVSMFTAVTVTRTFMALVFHGDRIESIRQNTVLLDYK